MSATKKTAWRFDSRLFPLPTEENRKHCEFPEFCIPECAAGTTDVRRVHEPAARRIEHEPWQKQSSSTLMS